MKIPLRKYQRECHDSILNEWRTHRSTLGVLATGTGKTHIMAAVIETMQPKRAMVIAERRELVEQTALKIYEATGLQCEIEMGNRRASTSLFHRMPVIVATVQSLRSGKGIKRIHRFNPEDFGVLAIDEAHHAPAPQYFKVVDHFQKNPELRTFGMTATPDRKGGEALGQIFETVAFRYEILQAVQEGWLVDVTQQFCRVNSLDFSHVHTIQGDLDATELAAIMEAEQNIQGVCHPSLEVVYGLAPQTLSSINPTDWNRYLTSIGKTPRRSIMFTSSVAHAEMCCNIFNRVIPGIAEWICGETPPEKRHQILSRFRSGITPIVMNCNVLTEGFDNPAVEVILMARPTKSRALYTQMIGRSTRPLPGIVDNLPTVQERLKGISASQKPYCRIIDFVGNSGKHKLVTSLDILGGKVSEEVAGRTMIDALKNGKPIRVCRELSKTESRLETEKRERAEQQRLAEELRKNKLYAKSHFSQYSINAFGMGESGPAQQWKDKGKRGPTEKMKGVLRRNGFPDPDKFSFKQAIAIIGKLAKEQGWNKTI